MSKYYDLIAAPSEKRFKDIGIEMLDLRAGMRVLELGCGTGYSLEKISKLVGGNGKIFGCDISEGMLTQTQKRLSKSSFPSKAHIFQTNILDPPIKKKIFDRIFLCFVLEIFPDEDIRQVLGNCRSLLKDDGQICVVSIQYEKNIPIKIYEWAHRKFPNVVDCRPIELEMHLLEAGYELVKKRREKMWGLPIEIISAK
jgi:demethylmenaquinone methyltransferase/2-methoxy-6-polyprenyl-1,4-benzoquinol methylase